MSIGQLLVLLVQGVNIVVVLWCLLSWFPNIRWYEQPFKTLDSIVRPILEPFRRLIPPIGNIDISPMIAIMLLQALANAVAQFVP